MCSFMRIYAVTSRLAEVEQSLSDRFEANVNRVLMRIDIYLLTRIQERKDMYSSDTDLCRSRLIRWIESLKNSSILDPDPYQF